ncbi:15781_t:CDS:2, partial [Acaulospora colombiana]
VIDAGLPSLYLIGSLCILISAYIQQRRRKGSNYERLLNNQSNSSYGSIAQTVVIDEDESSVDDSNSISDVTLVPDECDKNVIFDYTRLLVSLISLGLFCALAIVRWKNYSDEKHGYYWVITPVVEAAIWIYAIVLAVINVASRQRSVLHI